MDTLVESIKRHEGVRYDVFLDSEDKLTCGRGHYLRLGSRVPVEAVEAFFKQDVAAAVSAYGTIQPYLRKKLNAVRARVIVEMIFQLGLNGVMKFRNMWGAIEVEDFELAALCMLDSLWHEQTKGRAEELAEIMRKGE